jgi:hypothetical protein
MRNYILGFLQCIALALLAAAIVFGQAVTGSLSGTILDKNGAVVPAARVEATETESGVTLRTVSSDAGLYVFPAFLSALTP